MCMRCGRNAKPYPQKALRLCCLGLCSNKPIVMKGYIISEKNDSIRLSFMLLVRYQK